MKSTGACKQISGLAKRERVYETTNYKICTVLEILKKALTFNNNQLSAETKHALILSLYLLVFSQSCN